MYFMWIMEYVLLNHRKVFDMYLHIGKDYIIKNKDIVAIFNIDYVKNTKEYKSMIEKLKVEGNLKNFADNQEKTFILTENESVVKGYITNIGTTTIGKRKM